MSKSYWMNVTARTERQRAAILSWLGPVCVGMTVESAQVLCDKATDREKKIKAIVVDQSGTRKLATRTLGKNYTITLSPVRP